MSAQNRDFGVSQAELAKNPNNPLRTVEAHKAVHAYTDVDQDRDAQHHSLGPGEFQASPGNHGKVHLSGVRITGSRGGNAAVASIIAALVKLGAIDSTTP